MAKPHILQMGSYPAWDQEPLDAAFTVHRLWEAPDRAAFLAAVGPEVRAIATRGDLGASAEVIAACPKLEIVSVYGVGYDAVDLPACAARGIRVTNTPDVLTNDVADLGVAMMLVQSRGMIGAEGWVRDGSWAAKGSAMVPRPNPGAAGSRFCWTNLPAGSISLAFIFLGTYRMPSSCV